MTKGRYTPVSSSTTGDQPFWRPTTWTPTTLHGTQTKASK